MSNIRTRFAPSPTGFLHIGGVRTALYAYLFAKKDNGTFILRIEDTDRERLVEGATEMIIKTLNDTGLYYDEGPEKGGGYGPYIQSERKALYAQYAEELIAKDGAYYCFCSKERLDQLKEHQTQHKLAFKYDGHCRNLSKDDIEKQKNENTVYVVRQKTPQSGTTSFSDEVYGTITVNNIDLDDGVLMKSNGLPTYNFANVVDDHLMEITHVIRGSEFLSSTPKFQALYFAFGWKPPVYVHLPPIMKNARQKLSKRDGDASFYDLLGRGYMKEAVLNYIALLGWNPGTTQEIFSMEELKQTFSVKGINKAPAIFDMEKLNWMNGEYIKLMSEKEFHERALPLYKQSLKTSIDLQALSHVIHTRTKKFTDIPEMIDFFDALPEYDTALYVHKKMKTTEESSLEILHNIKPVVEGIEEWLQEKIHDTLFAYIQNKKLKNGQVLWPLRTALSGKQFTPGGGIEIAYLLGKEETLSRIDIGIKKLEVR